MSLLALDEHVMLSAVREWIEAQFGAAPNLAPIEGADPKLKRTLPEPNEIVGIPEIVLSLQSDSPSVWAGANGKERDCGVNIECRANEFAGSIEGAENPESAHVTIARAIRGFDRNEIEGAEPFMNSIQTLSENAQVVSMRLFLTYCED